MLIGETRCAPSAGGAGDEALLEQVWLIHILYGNGLLIDRCRKRIQAYRSPAVLQNDAAKEPSVDIVQSAVVDVQPGEGIIGHGLGDDTVCGDFREGSMPMFSSSALR